MKKLVHHRMDLANNPEALVADIERCYKSVVPHLKSSGFQKITFRRAASLIRSYVDAVFRAQNCKPFFWIESASKLPFCWNSPQKLGWELNYIKYEWGHLLSQNQGGFAAHDIENLCLQSARCNQHIQSSMNVDELLEYDGKLARVIKSNLDNRRKLFESDDWKIIKSEFEKWK